MPGDHSTPNNQPRNSLLLIFYFCFGASLYTYHLWYCSNVSKMTGRLRLRVHNKRNSLFCLRLEWFLSINDMAIHILSKRTRKLIIKTYRSNIEWKAPVFSSFRTAASSTRTSSLVRPRTPQKSFNENASKPSKICARFSMPMSL